MAERLLLAVSPTPPESRNEGRQGSTLPLVEPPRCPNLEDVWTNGREAASLPPRHGSESEGSCFPAGWPPSYEGREAGLVPRSARPAAAATNQREAASWFGAGKAGKRASQAQPEQRIRGKLLRSAEQGRQGSGPPSLLPWLAGLRANQREAASLPAGRRATKAGNLASSQAAPAAGKAGKRASQPAPPETVLLR